MTSIKPSPALTLSEHTSIGDTISFLIEHQVGSVIITAYNDAQKPIGIFSERDLLKWVLKFGQSNLWATAIGNIMTRGLITVKTTEMEKANELMIKNHIRHIPVVFDDDDGVTRLAGMISMRDAFKSLVEANKTILEKYSQLDIRKSVTVLARNPQSRKLQSSILANRANIRFLPETSDKDEIAKEARSSEAFIFDIDQYSPQEWTSILKSVLEKGHSDVYLLLDQLLHDQKSVTALKTMQTGGVLTVFYKPINIIQYLTKIEQTLTALAPHLP